MEEDVTEEGRRRRGGTVEVEDEKRWWKKGGRENAAEEEVVEEDEEEERKSANARAGDYECGQQQMDTVRDARDGKYEVGVIFSDSLERPANSAVILKFELMYAPMMEDG
ncbi:hypothetical protein BHE74_00046305 [Ensete ventricosum]|nr:hypothetical protein GW17_00054464 [Ensete ventricosum]RWW47681.1 hypothetical protein BHE74_00046305 [Ensete ventricosum]